ncbi:MAG: mobile mystery protein A [Bacteroidales bacterium]
MTYWDKKLLREQLDKKLQALKAWRDSGSAEIGWVRTIRKALGMTAEDMARKVGIDQSRISRIENAEMEGNIKLSSLKKIAEGMEMDFVYGFVPVRHWKKMVREQPGKSLPARMERLHHTMRLEMQGYLRTNRDSALTDTIDQIPYSRDKTL